MRLHISELKSGYRLMEHVYNMEEELVLPSGTTLSDDNIAMLRNNQVIHVNVSFGGPSLQDLPLFHDPLPVPAPPEPASPGHFAKAVQSVKSMFTAVANNNYIDEQLLEESFQPLIENFRSESDVVELLLTLNTDDDYTYNHSVQVGLISYFIAKWMGKPEQEALFIGKAGCLHDIGKSKISNDILYKPSKLTPEEFEIMKQHTIYGFDILTESTGNISLAQVALQHHERGDGLGYPHGVTAKDIHPLAKIVAVADVYSAMISTRVYQRQRDLLFVLRELFKMSFGELDPVATQTFIRYMLPHFIGKKVTMKDGSVGTIVMTNPTDFFHPLVRINEQFVDLAQKRDLEIDMIYV